VIFAWTISGGGEWWWCGDDFDYYLGCQFVFVSPTDLYYFM